MSCLKSAGLEHRVLAQYDTVSFELSVQEMQMRADARANTRGVHLSRLTPGTNPGVFPVIFMSCSCDLQKSPGSLAISGSATCKTCQKPQFSNDFGFTTCKNPLFSSDVRFTTSSKPASLVTAGLQFSGS